MNLGAWLIFSFAICFLRIKLTWINVGDENNAFRFITVEDPTAFLHKNVSTIRWRHFFLIWILHPDNVEAHTTNNCGHNDPMDCDYSVFNNNQKNIFEFAREIPSNHCVFALNSDVCPIYLALRSSGVRSVQIKCGCFYLRFYLIALMQVNAHLLTYYNHSCMFYLLWPFSLPRKT